VSRAPAANCCRLYSFVTGFSQTDEVGHPSLVQGMGCSHTNTAFKLVVSNGLSSVLLRWLSKHLKPFATAAPRMRTHTIR
jgi:hypothetical protein